MNQKYFWLISFNFFLLFNKNLYKLITNLGIAPRKYSITNIHTLKKKILIYKTETVIFGKKGEKNKYTGLDF